ncbi:MAG: hypothetical protein ABSF64_02110 [Bryobacteraceae bacterium]|jgi:hypothetical protein
MQTTFRVSRVFDDGTETDALIVPAAALPAGVRMGRRVFFRAGITLSAVAAALTGCGSPDSQAPAASTPGADASPSPPPAPGQPGGSSADGSARPRVPKAAAPQRARRRPPDNPYPSAPSGGYIGGYSGGVTTGETIEKPCTPEPVPDGYICTCNCVAR